MKCPCCSGLDYTECCKSFHEGAAAPTALALMRSRYSAYALKKPEYIRRTTHPKSPYYEKNAAVWQSAILEFCENTKFEKLEILESSEDTVKFAAHLNQGGRAFILEEKSQFRKVDGKWLYLEGSVVTKNKNPRSQDLE